MGKRRDAQQITAQERRIKALELRKKGKSYRDIADTLKQEGIEVSHVQIKRDIEVALSELSDDQKTAVQNYRQLAIERLTSYLDRLATKIELGSEAAINQAVKIEQEIAKLMGTYAPTETKHSGVIGVNWESIMKANEDGSSTPDPENPFS